MQRREKPSPQKSLSDGVYLRFGRVRRAGRECIFDKKGSKFDKCRKTVRKWCMVCVSTGKTPESQKMRRRKIMKNEEKKRNKAEKKIEKRNRKLMHEMQIPQTVELPQEAENEQVPQTVEAAAETAEFVETPDEKTAKRRARLHRPVRFAEKNREKKLRLAPVHLRALYARLCAYVAAHKKGTRRVLVATLAVLLAANVVTTSVFIAYSVRTRRGDEDNYWSNYWEIDDLREQINRDADDRQQETAQLEENMDQWKTGESIYSGEIGENLTWTIDPETAELVIDGSGEMDSSFSENRRPAFGMLYADFVRTLTVGDSVESIAPYAFENFTALESVTLGDMTETIGECAFSGCEQLLCVETGESLQRIEENAFYGCESLTNLSLPSCIARVEPLNTESSHIRFSVEEGGDYSSDDNGCLFTDEGKTLVSCPVGTHYDYNSPAESFTVPEGVNKLAPYCFAGCRFKTLTVSGGVKTVPLEAFQNMDADTLKFSDGVVNLKGEIGEECWLGTIVIPQTMKFVDENLFDSHMRSVQAGSKQKALKVTDDGQVYSGDGKTLLFVTQDEDRGKLRVAEGTTRIRAGALRDMVLSQGIVLPGTLRIIDDDNFNYIRFGDDVVLTLPDGLRSIGDNCLQFCHIKKVVLPDSLLQIGSGFLMDTNMNSYDELSDQDVEIRTTVVFDGTQKQWNDLFANDAPENIKFKLAD